MFEGFLVCLPFLVCGGLALGLAILLGFIFGLEESTRRYKEQSKRERD